MARKNRFDRIFENASADVKRLDRLAKKSRTPQSGTTIDRRKIPTVDPVRQAMDRAGMRLGAVRRGMESNGRT